MTPFSVWTPNAKKMEVEADGKRYGMTAGDKGWWYAEPPLDTGAADYAFIIDGGQPLPDPRSAWQPGGIHKAFRLVDHKVFHWTDQRWQAPPLAAAVIHELHIGTFTPEGTFAAVIDKLDHLVRRAASRIGGDPDMPPMIRGRDRDVDREWPWAPIF